MTKSTRNVIEDSADALETTLDAKNRGAAADAVAAAVAYQGSDDNLVANIATAAGVSVTYAGSTENALDAVEAAVADLAVVP